jgi:hypothetical protein
LGGYGEAVTMVAAAVCPHPPILVPEVACGAAAELNDLRAACDEAVSRLAAARPDHLVIIGSGPVAAEHPVPVRGSFAPWGVALETSLGTGPAAGGADELPLSLLVGVWLANRAFRPDRPVDIHLTAVAAGGGVAECAAVGASAASRGERVALLVLGDGSARRGIKAPGYDDPRAEPFDTAVADALAAADRGALLALDPALAEDLIAAGRAPWQALAGAADDGRQWRGDLLYADAPYGVGYLVATWTPV